VLPIAAPWLMVLELERFGSSAPGCRPSEISHCFHFTSSGTPPPLPGRRTMKKFDTKMIARTPARERRPSRELLTSNSYAKSRHIKLAGSRAGWRDYGGESSSALMSADAAAITYDFYCKAPGLCLKQVPRDKQKAPSTRRLSLPRPRVLRRRRPGALGTRLAQYLPAARATCA